MEAGELLREARRSSGFSQRALAERAKVSRRVVEAAESGRLAPRADVLDALLRACGSELASRPLPTVEVDEVLLAEHLRLSVTRRVCLAAGGTPGHVPGARTPLWAAVCRLARVEGEVAAFDGPLALAAWLPEQTVREGQSLALPRMRMGALARDCVLALDVQPGRWPPDLVPVRLPGGRGRSGGDLLVPTPRALAERAAPELAAVLGAAARLLHGGCARDAAGRRVPAHRRPDEEQQVDEIRARYCGRIHQYPSLLDSPTWRLGAAGSVHEEVVRRGLVRHEPKPGWSRWGWR